MTRSADSRGVWAGAALALCLALVNIALGTTSVAQRNSGDSDGDNQVTIDEILMAVNVALSGCGG